MDEPQVVGRSWAKDLKSHKFDGSPLQSLCNQYGTGLPTCAFMVSGELGEILVKGETSFIAMLPLSSRLKRSLVQPDNPEFNMLKRWVKNEFRLAAKDRDAVDDNAHCDDYGDGHPKLWELPANAPEFQPARGWQRGKNSEFAKDACQILKGLKFGNRLTTLKDFTAP